MRNKLLSSLVIILLILGIGVFLSPQSTESQTEKRLLTTNNDVALNDNFFKTLDNILKDQFYFRENIVNKHYQVKVTLAKLFGSNVINDVELTYLSDEVIEINDGYLINSILEYSEDQLQSASDRGYNQNQFDLMFPDVKTYVYFPTKIEELLCENTNYVPACRNNYTDQLNSNVTYSWLEINSIEDYQKYYFKSEDHWNIDGAYKGYSDIIEMISNDYPNIGSPKSIKERIDYPYLFSGSLSCKLGKLNIYENLSDYILDNMNEFDFYRDGVLEDFDNVKEEYKNNGNNSVYSDYDLYFGNNNYMRLFDFNDESKPNLLIFADSYINSNMQWIASHFNKTLIIDLRAKPEDFSLSSVISEYDIDIALTVLSYNTMYFNGYMYIPLN